MIVIKLMDCEMLAANVRISNNELIKTWIIIVILNDSATYSLIIIRIARNGDM